MANDYTKEQRTADQALVRQYYQDKKQARNDLVDAGARSVLGPAYDGSDTSRNQYSQLRRAGYSQNAIKTALDGGYTWDQVYSSFNGQKRTNPAKNYLAENGGHGRYYSAGAATTASSSNVSDNRNTRKEQEDQEVFQNRGWDEKTPGYITQGAGPKGKQTFLDRAIAAIARNAELPEDDNPVATAEGMTPGDYHNQKGELLRQEMLASQGKPYYGLGNIDLNNRPTLQNPDGSYSTVDSFSTNINGREVLLPTVINVNGQWQHVDENTAIQHYLSTGQYLGVFDTPQEATNYARMLHENQDAFYSARRGRN